MRRTVYLSVTLALVTTIRTILMTEVVHSRRRTPICYPSAPSPPPPGQFA